MKKYLLLPAACLALTVAGCASNAKVQKIQDDQLQATRETNHRLNVLEAQVTNLNSMMAQVDTRVYEVRNKRGRNTGLTAVPAAPLQRLAPPVAAQGTTASQPVPGAAAMPAGTGGNPQTAPAAGQPAAPVSAVQPAGSAAPQKNQAGPTGTLPDQSNKTSGGQAAPQTPAQTTAQTAAPRPASAPGVIQGTDIAARMQARAAAGGSKPAATAPSHKKTPPAPRAAQPVPAQTSGPSGQVGQPVAGPSGQLAAPAPSQPENAPLGLPPVSVPQTSAPDAARPSAGNAAQPAVPAGQGSTVAVPSVSANTLALPPEHPSLPPMTPGAPVQATATTAQPSTGQAVAGQTAGQGQPQTSVQPAASAPQPAARAARGEKAQYDAALRLARSGQSAQGIAQFQNFLQQYPQGKYVVNAHYWIGECLYAQGKYQEALGQFQLINGNYPRHHKNADALLKAGMSLRELGDKAGAKAKYEALIQQFPNSNAASLVRSRGMVR